MHDLNDPITTHKLVEFDKTYFQPRPENSAVVVTRVAEGPANNHEDKPQVISVH